MSVYTAGLNNLPAIRRRVPELSGPIRSTEVLEGGLINRTYRLNCDAGSFVVRQFAADSELLGIDRDAEHEASLAAALAGVGPRVIAYLPDLESLVLEFVEGETLHGDALTDPRRLQGLAETLRRFHGTAPLSKQSDWIAGRRRVLDLAAANGYRVPERYAEIAPVAEQIEAALRTGDWPEVSCHNDLMLENFIDAGDQVQLVDYEYAGRHDPWFDIASIWSASDLGPNALEELVAAYHGDADPRLVARSKLWSLLWHYGWAAIASVRAGAGVGTSQWDAWAWAQDHVDVAIGMARDLDVDDLIRLGTG